MTLGDVGVFLAIAACLKMVARHSTPLPFLFFEFALLGAEELSSLCALCSAPACFACLPLSVVPFSQNGHGVAWRRLKEHYELVWCAWAANQASLGGTCMVAWDVIFTACFSSA